jgi:hypothetical protein
LYILVLTQISTLQQILVKKKKKTTAIVVQLIKILLNMGHTVWTDNYYNSPDLAAFWKKNMEPVWPEHYASTEKMCPPQ